MLLRCICLPTCLICLACIGRKILIRRHQVHDNFILEDPGLPRRIWQLFHSVLCAMLEEINQGLAYSINISPSPSLCVCDSVCPDPLICFLTYITLTCQFLATFRLLTHICINSLLNHFLSKLHRYRQTSLNYLQVDSQSENFWKSPNNLKSMTVSIWTDI